MKRIMVVVAILATVLLVSPVSAWDQEKPKNPEVKTSIEMNNNVKASAEANAKAEAKSNSVAVATGGNAKANATGGNATATGGKGGKGGTGGSATGGNAYNDLTVVNEDKREHITALPGPVGVFVNAPTVIDDGKWHPLPPKIFTVGELKQMVNSSGYWDRQGSTLDKAFTGPVKTTRHVPIAKGELDDNTKIYVFIPDNVCWIKRTLAESYGIGPYHAPLGAIQSLTILEPVLETHALGITGFYRTRKDAKSSGLSVGSGVGGSVVGNGDAQAGSMAVGAITGSASAYGKSAFDVDLEAGEIECAAPPIKEMTVIPEPTPSAEPPAEPKKVCNPEVFDRQVYEYEHEIKWCEFPGYNNQALRFGKGNAFVDKYYCEGGINAQLLLRAEYEYGVAERDFKNGRELAAGQKFGDKPKGVLTPTLPEARELNYKVHYNWALVKRLLYRPNVEAKFARDNQLNTTGSMDMPTGYSDLKR